MTRQHLIPLAMFALLFAVEPHSLQAQQAAGDWVVRVYHVADLVVQRPDYPYRGNEIPTTGSSLGNASPTISSGGFSGGGFGGGGFFQVSDSGLSGSGLDSGGGFFGAEPTETTSTGFTIDDLIQAIQATIDPESWDVSGGSGVCTPLGGMLIIKQTPPAHTEIEDLLTAIRGEGGADRTVSVRARWLLADADELAAISAGDAADAPATVVDRAALEQLAATATRYEGRITCYSNQTVHFASGARRSAIVSAIPVVSAMTVGYQPLITLPNLGVLLEVKPTLIPDQRQAVLNLTSTVTSAKDPGETVSLSIPTPTAGSRSTNPTVEIGTSTIQLDRLNLDTQHLATTVRVPLGQPVLVGGMSQSSEEDGSQLSLIIEVTAHGGP